jgi:hypothetical protein
VSLNDLLKARSRHLEEVRRRERILKFRLFAPKDGTQTERNPLRHRKRLVSKYFWQAGSQKKKTENSIRRGS